MKKVLSSLSYGRSKFGPKSGENCYVFTHQSITFSGFHCFQIQCVLFLVISFQTPPQNGFLRGGYKTNTSMAYLSNSYETMDQYIFIQYSTVQFRPQKSQGFNWFNYLSAVSLKLKFCVKFFPLVKFSPCGDVFHLTVRRRLPGPGGPGHADYPGTTTLHILQL